MEHSYFCQDSTFSSDETLNSRAILQKLDKNSSFQRKFSAFNITSWPKIAKPKLRNDKEQMPYEILLQVLELILIKKGAGSSQSVA
jgi:hypothetical protein